MRLVVAEVLVFPAVSVTVTVSFEVTIPETPTVPVQVTDPPDSAPQDIFAIVITHPVSTQLQVVVTDVPAGAGEGVEEHTGVAGATVSIPDATVPVPEVFPTVSVAVTEISSPSIGAGERVQV